MPAEPSLQELAAAFAKALEAKDYEGASKLLTDELRSSIPKTDKNGLAALEKEAKARERKKAWDGAIAVRQVLEVVGGPGQTETIAALEKKRDIEKAESEIKNATKTENWQTVIDELKKLEKLTGKSKETEIGRAAQKRDKATWLREHELKVFRMRQGVSSGGVALSVQEGEHRRCLSSWCGRDETRFLLLHATLENLSSDTLVANPHGFSLVACGYEYPHESATYSLNHFPAVTVYPGNRAAGWLAFSVNRRCARLQLRYSMFGAPLLLDIVGSFDPD